MDKKHKKKLKRKHKKKQDKKTVEALQNKIKQQMNMFDRLPSSCSACNKKFPLTREAHMTWQVVVRSKQETVRLFCPECQQKAQQVLENSNEV